MQSKAVLSTVLTVANSVLSLAWLTRHQPLVPSCILAGCRPCPPSSSLVRRTILLARRNGDDEDDEDIPEVDVSQFQPPSLLSYGLYSGRSSPMQRKAMGRSASGTASIHVCTNCASEFVQWMGRCPTCREWNTLQQQVVTRQALPGGVAGSRPRPSPTQGNGPPADAWFGGAPGVGRTPTRLADVIQKSQGTAANERLHVPDDQELNNVLGGGIMPASLILMGGEPGVGKSTLLLQVAASIAAECPSMPGIGMGSASPDVTKGPGPVWYVSGEETQEQIASRAMRLGIQDPELYLLSETHADSLCQMVYQSCAASDSPNSNLEQAMLRPPSLMVVDSIQTMVCDAGGASAAGGITQVRECVALFLRLAKTCRIPIILVGHVTKSGGVAGPRTVEHMVDCVLYMEGPSQGGSLSSVRVLRASKNRFGSSDEIGIYEMTSGRLLPVSDPSSLFLAHRATQTDMDGSATAIALEGKRAIAVEVQALVTSAGGGAATGRRTVDGIAMSRLWLLLGVLQKRCGIFLARQDVYINIVGRMRLERGEGNAADLAIAVSLVSSLSNIAVRADTAFVGEVGLLGELRPVGSLEKRVEEARRMGFSRIITPKTGIGKRRSSPAARSSNSRGVEWFQCETLQEAINAGLVENLPKGRKKTRNPPFIEDIPGSLEQLEEILDDQDDPDDVFM